MKKRRVLWVGIALAVAAALFAAIAFSIDYNSADTRIERAMAQIVEEYGFKYQHRARQPSSQLIEELYLRAPVDAATASQILATLREGCPSCRYYHAVMDEDGRLVEATGGDPWWENHNFTPDERDGGLIEVVTFSPRNDGQVQPGHGREAHLYLAKLARPSLWQRIKGLWPW